MNIILANNKYCQNKPLKISIPEEKFLHKRSRVLFGKISTENLIIGKRELPYNLVDINLLSETKSVDVSAGSTLSPAVFIVNFVNPRLGKQQFVWDLQILSQDLKVVSSVSSLGRVPEKILWSLDKKDKKIIPDKSYFYVLKIQKKDGSFSFTTSPKPFVLRNVSSMRFSIPIKRLSSYKRIISKRKFKRFLIKVSKKIKKHPKEKINIVGYVNRTEPKLCENIARLRNYLTTKTKIPLERFYTFCEFVNVDSKKSKYVSIYGVSPKKNIDLIPYKLKENNKLLIYGNKISVTEEQLFLATVQKDKPLKIDFETKNGLRMEINSKPKTYTVRLKKGKNKIKKISYVDLNVGEYAIYCKEYKPREVLNTRTSVLFGLGPYSISDSYSPDGMHLLASVLMFNHKFESFLPGLVDLFGFNPAKFVFEGTLFSVPVHLMGSENAKQTIYNIDFSLAYAFINEPFVFKLGYVYVFYYSQDSVYKNIVFSESMFNSGLTIEFASSNNPFKHFVVRELIKIYPMLYAKMANYAAENNLEFSYPLGSFISKYGSALFLKYRKFIMNYTSLETARKTKENQDAVILGLDIGL